MYTMTDNTGSEIIGMNCCYIHLISLHQNFISNLSSKSSLVDQGSLQIKK
jgi:hypothetical protein